MTIDIGALRRFQATWGPVIEIIPDVINMAEQQADLERGLAAKRLELSKATAEIDEAFAEANKKLADADNNLVALGEKKLALVADIADARQAAAAAAEAAEASAKLQLAAVEVKIAESSAALAKVGDQIAAETSEAQAKHAEAVKVMQAEIIDLEKRKAAAEKALDTLRAKLG